MFIREINKIFVSTFHRRALNVRQQGTHAMLVLTGNRVCEESEDASVCAVACFVLPYISFLSSLSPQTSDS